MEKGWVKRNKWIFFAGPLALAAFIAIGGEIVMHLWNWLLPALFGWRLITFWQALGLLVLCRVLFGGWGSHGGDPHRSRHSKEMCRNPMTPEERERLLGRNARGEGDASEIETGASA
jgi:hypothetical protein